MRHVFGYVVPSFNFDEAISKSLKEDYLIMAKLQRELGAKGDVLIFYIVTMNTDIALKIRHLAEEYKHKSIRINMVFVGPDQSDIQYAIRKLELPTQDLGGIMVVANSNNLTDEKRKSIAKKAGKRCLMRYLKYRETAVKKVTEIYEIPPGVDWDYYAKG